MPAWIALVTMLGVGSSASGQRADRPTARRAYYAVRYADENGPFLSERRAVEASLRTLYARAQDERWGCEWLALISRDRYGAWWYTSPKTGHEVAPDQCEVTYSSAEVHRPGSTLVATAHTHPRGDAFPDPRAHPPDNQNAHPMFLLRSDGVIWRFEPRTTRPAFYGTMRDGAVEGPSSPASPVVRAPRAS